MGGYGGTNAARGLTRYGRASVVNVCRGGRFPRANVTAYRRYLEVKYNELRAYRNRPLPRAVPRWRAMPMLQG